MRSNDRKYEIVAQGNERILLFNGYDIDKAFVDIIRIKRDELGLQKVKAIRHLTNQTT